MSFIEELSGRKAHEKKKEKLDGTDPADTGWGSGGGTSVKILIDTKRVGIAKG